MEAGRLGGVHGLDQWLNMLLALIRAEPEPATASAALAPLAALGVDVAAVEATVARQLEAPPGDWHSDDWRHSNPDFPEKYAVAIFVYTLQHPNVYQLLGAALRAADRASGPDGVSAEVRACLPYTKLLDVALVEAAIEWGFFTGKTLRGVQYAFPRPTVAEHDPEAYFPSGQPGGPPARELYWYGFCSSSTEFEVMYQPWFCGKSGPRTVFTIQSCEGVSIRRFSSIPDENEVLFRPGAHFRVTASSKRLRPADLGANPPTDGGFPDDIHLLQLKTFDAMAEIQARTAQLRSETASVKEQKDRVALLEQELAAAQSEIQWVEAASAQHEAKATALQAQLEAAQRQATRAHVLRDAPHADNDRTEGKHDLQSYWQAQMDVVRVENVLVLKHEVPLVIDEDSVGPHLKTFNFEAARGSTPEDVLQLYKEAAQQFQEHVHEERYDAGSADLLWAQMPIIATPIIRTDRTARLLQKPEIEAALGPADHIESLLFAPAMCRALKQVHHDLALSLEACLALDDLLHIVFARLTKFALDLQQPDLDGVQEEILDPRLQYRIIGQLRHIFVCHPVTLAGNLWLLRDESVHTDPAINDQVHDEYECECDGYVCSFVDRATLLRTPGMDIQLALWDSKSTNQQEADWREFLDAAQEDRGGDGLWHPFECGARDVQTAVRVALPHELARDAASAGERSVTNLVCQLTDGATLAQKSGLTFPVARIGTWLDTRTHRTWTQAGVVYMSGVLECLATKLLELAGNTAHDSHDVVISLRHIEVAIRNDTALHLLFRQATVLGAGVMPCMHHVFANATIPDLLEQTFQGTECNFICLPHTPKSQEPLEVGRSVEQEAFALPSQAFNILAARAGIALVSTAIYGILRSIVVKWLEKVLRLVIEFSEHVRKQVITHQHILRALASESGLSATGSDCPTCTLVGTGRLNEVLWSDPAPGAALLCAGAVNWQAVADSEDAASSSSAEVYHPPMELVGQGAPSVVVEPSDLQDVVARLRRHAESGAFFAPDNEFKLWLQLVVGLAAKDADSCATGFTAAGYADVAGLLGSGLCKSDLSTLGAGSDEVVSRVASVLTQHQRVQGDQRPMSTLWKRSLQMIREEQTGHSRPVFPFFAFARLAKSVTGQFKMNVKFERSAMRILDEACETYLVQLLQDAKLATIQAERVVVTPDDIQLAIKSRCKGHTGFLGSTE